MEKKMSKKKSYMNKENIINEGILDKIFDLIRRGKVNKLRKAFRDQPDIRKRIENLNKYAEDLEKRVKDAGLDPKKIHRIK